MNIPSRLDRAAIGLALSLGAMAAGANEGDGLTVYPDGLETFMVGALPPPGVHALVYGGGAEYTKLRDNGGHEVPVPDFKVDVGVVAPRIVWVTDQTVLGGQLAFHAIAPLLDVHFKAGGMSWHSSGLGDVAFGPALGYHVSPTLHYVAAFDFIAPTGSYDAADPSSLGHNHWALQPIFALTQVDPDGLNADVKVMYDINARNNDTKTRTGQALHADYDLGWGFAHEWAAGVGGHVFQQVSDDSGPVHGTGKARALAIGPAIRFFDGKGLLVTAKLQKEFAVRNRPEGTQLYLKATLPF